MEILKSLSPDQVSIHLFGEKSYFFKDNAESKEKSKIYLSLWKENLIENLKRDTIEIKIIEEHWGEREANLCGGLCQRGFLYLKISLQISFRFEISPMASF